MNDEKLTGTLQENLITLMSYSDTDGKVVAGLIDPALFEGDYRVIAERVAEFWRRHREAPKTHTPDLLADILDDPANRRGRTFKRILSAMIDLAPTINSKYVLDQLRTFTRMQRLKDAILKSAERLNAQQEFAIAEVEEIWQDLLRSQEVVFERGVTLSSVEGLVDYLEKKRNEFRTGIEHLDRAHIVPARQELFILLAPPGRGKSWGLVTLGKETIKDRKKVLHISLEMNEYEVLQRYIQSLWAITKREGLVSVTSLVFDNEESGSDVIGFDYHDVDPKVTFQSTILLTELQSHVSLLGLKSEYLIIKQFPPHTLTAASLEAYMDMLEVREGFIPDLVIVDYAGLMKTDEKNHRISLGRQISGLRGIGVKRNQAIATAMQVSREGAQAAQVSTTHVSEDWSAIMTADVVVTLSSTEEEFKMGLARLYVGKARTEEDRFGVLITQNFKIGQFALMSALLKQSYFDLIRVEDPDDTDYND